MRNGFRWLTALGLAVALAGCCDDDDTLGVIEAGGSGPALVQMGPLASYAVLAGTAVINNGATVCTGNIGVSPGNNLSGFPPGICNGIILIDNAAAADAQDALDFSCQDARGRSLDIIHLNGNLGGRFCAPGLYRAAQPVTLTGTLTLDALGNENAVFIFQVPALVVSSGSKIVLRGGARASNVFWHVDNSATLGSTCQFVGVILAEDNITLNSGARLNGRALARDGAVTLNSCVIVP